MGVNFGAMDKYRKPLSAEQWKTCAKSLKVSFLIQSLKGAAAQPSALLMTWSCIPLKL